MLMAAAIMIAPVAVPADPAAEIARALTPRENFRSMILMTLDRNEAGADIARVVGEPRADALLAEAAEEMSYRYAAQWEANLAEAYRISLSPEELATALAAVRRADHEALTPLSARVGGALYRKSAGLLQQASAEAIRAAQTQAGGS